MEKNYKFFINSLLTKNKKYDYFVNWKSVIEQIKKRYENSIELNALNSLIKSSDFKLKFMELLDKVPTVITVFPLLIATSKDTREKLFEQKEKLEILDEEEQIEKFDFSEKIAKRGFNLQQKEKYYIFFEKIGLKRLFEEIIEKVFMTI
ncbi:DpnII restriction endonuclease [Mycoplasmopsis gallinacea]|uniref:DpnII restriction endonuclease n=1 Tax=Mycoplasmopsis gallinacea TaxID=29556 RepID=A0A449A3W5_9BACT|nr:DpnII family type II restriction endonuclease [Mycoplasmopsis gallinacea]VEU58936.1 DpnII restriction endonuclease [Mycoplasmopsis gallinacea]